MISYTPLSQLSIESFKTPFEANLASSNRWVELGKLIPWDKLAQVYCEQLDSHKGRKGLDARRAIGAMIIKHMLKLSDRETVAIISENPYMQHFLGLSSFQAKGIFDASLFVHLRKRMGTETFDAFTRLIISEVNGIKPKGTSSHQGAKKNKQVEHEVEEVRLIATHTAKVEITASEVLPEQSAAKEEIESQAGINLSKEDIPEPSLNNEVKPKEVTHPDQELEAKPKPKLKGKLKLDATVADIYIAYPTDLDLLNKSREWSEKIIDKLCIDLALTTKPRTYRRLARKSYLDIIKKKNKSKKVLRAGLRMQLNCVKRNLGYIDKMLGEVDYGKYNLSKKHGQYYKVIKEVYAQQSEMFEDRVNRCKERIVSLSQPYVRPIVRGKRKHKVELGPKLGLSLVEGYTRIDTMSWTAYHEGERDFKKSVESYYEIYGYYPELVQVDQLYSTRENRQWAKEKGIRLTAKALGRPRKETQETKKLNSYERRKRKQEHAERNHIEGKIGQGKQGYRLNEIRTKTEQTAASWISCIIFVMNIIKFRSDMKKKKGGYFLWFIKMLIYVTEEKIYSWQRAQSALFLAPKY